MLPQRANATIKEKEEALYRATAYGKALNDKLEYQRVTIAQLNARLAREQKNIAKLTDELRQRIVCGLWHLCVAS